MTWRGLSRLVAAIFLCASLLAIAEPLYAMLLLVMAAGCMVISTMVSDDE